MEYLIRSISYSLIILVIMLVAARLSLPGLVPALMLGVGILFGTRLPPWHIFLPTLLWLMVWNSRMSLTLFSTIFFIWLWYMLWRVFAPTVRNAPLVIALYTSAVAILYYPYIFLFGQFIRLLGGNTFISTSFNVRGWLWSSGFALLGLLLILPLLSWLLRPFIEVDKKLYRL